MGLVRIEEIDNITEELLVAGMISSNAYISYVSERIDFRYFKNEYCKTVAELVHEFYTLHKRAPGSSIRELFESIVDHISGEEAKVIEHLLKTINKKYGDREISFDVLKDTTDDYFEIRSMEVLTDKLSGLTARGKTDEAMTELDRWYTDPKRNIIRVLSPFDSSMAEAVMTADEILYRFGNDLDTVMPPQRRNKLYTFLGGTKSGKSQWLGSLGVLFAEAGLKVATWQFELTHTEFIGRQLSNITGKILDPRHGTVTTETELSVFDCELNRSRECELPQCPDNPEEFNFSHYNAEEEEWITCTHCRGLPEFKPVVWKEPFTVGVINSPSQLRKEQVTWERQFGDNIRIFDVEPGSITVQDAKDQLERLRLTEGFVPDVLLFDAADNLAARSKYSEKRHEIGSVWLELSGLAKKGYLVWTASQTNRGGWGKEWIETSDIGEDASKLMVCDGVITINQFKGPDFDEYYWNTQRLRAYYFRSAKMPGRDVRVINDFSRYIACLDCYRM